MVSQPVEGGSPCTWTIITGFTPQWKIARTVVDHDHIRLGREVEAHLEDFLDELLEEDTVRICHEPAVVHLFHSDRRGLVQVEEDRSPEEDKRQVGRR